MISKAFLSLVLLLVALPFSYAKETYEDIIVSEVISIYDGDTFRVDIDNYPEIIGKNMPIRVKGIDTPEIRTKCDREKKLARNAKQLTVSLLRKAKIIKLKNIERGKYFRLVADVFVDGKLLSKELIKSKLAVPYDGKTAKINWCS